MARSVPKNADHLLLTAMACGATVEAAARAAGLSARTAHRRLADPDFARRLRATRDDFVTRTTGLLTGASLEAVKALVALLSPGAPPASRLGAARSVLEFGLKLRELTDLEARMSELERSIGGGS